MKDSPDNGKTESSTLMKPRLPVGLGAALFLSYSLFQTVREA
jgi:hypothetical protein